MALVTLVWAGNFTAGKVAAGTPDAPQFHPFVISAIRIWLGAAFFVFWLPAAQRRALFRPELIRAALPLALTGITTNQICFAAGIRLTLPSHSAIIHAIIPALVVLLGWAIARDVPRPLALAGMVIAVAGALSVALSAPADERRATLTGDVLTLAGALAFSTYIVLGRRIVPALGAWRAVTLGFVLSAPLMLPFFIYGAVRQDWHSLTAQSWAGLGYMIAGATFFCYSAHMWSLAHLDPLSVSVFVDLQPMLGTGIAALFGLEPVTGRLITGSLVAVCGVAVVQIASIKSASGRS